jgi:hypothetical protein
MITRKVLAFSSLEMGIDMKESSRKTKSMDLVNIIQILVMFSRVFLRMMFSRDGLYFLI